MGYYCLGRVLMSAGFATESRSCLDIQENAFHDAYVWHLLINDQIGDARNLFVDRCVTRTAAGECDGGSTSAVERPQGIPSIHSEGCISRSLLRWPVSIGPWYPVSQGRPALHPLRFQLWNFQNTSNGGVREEQPSDIALMKASMLLQGW